MSHYKPYPVYKDSGVEWIGKIPTHWETLRVKRGVLLRNERRSDSPEGWTYVGLEDVEPESGRYAPTPGASRQSEASMVGVFRAGDILYGKLRPYLRKSIVAEEDGICSTEFLVLSAQRATASWAHRWLLTPEVTQQIEAGCEGAKMPRADWDHVGSIPMPLPPAAEQSAIATAIDQETSRIDALIAKKTRFIELLQEKRRALITHAVTKGLDPNVKMRDSGVEWIGEVPEHWEVKRLRHAAKFRNSNVDKQSYDGQQAIHLCNYTDVYYNEFITSGLSFMPSTASAAEIEQFAIKRGDVIITKDSEDPSDIGIPAIVAEDLDGVVCGYHLTVIRGADLETARVIHRAIQSNPTKAHFFVEAPGITRYGLNQDAIGDTRICLPPPRERKNLADHIDRQTSRIDALIEKSKRSIDLLKERRSAFITAAVTGQIDLREAAVQTHESMT